MCLEYYNKGYVDCLFYLFFGLGHIKLYTLKPELFGQLHHIHFQLPCIAEELHSAVQSA